MGCGEGDLYGQGGDGGRRESGRWGGGSQGFPKA